MTHPSVADSSSVLTVNTVEWCSPSWGEEILSLRQVYNDSKWPLSIIDVCAVR